MFLHFFLHVFRIFWMYLLVIFTSWIRMVSRYADPCASGYGSTALVSREEDLY